MNSDDPLSDPATYRAMSVPFATAKEANQALDDFYRDLRALRAKHRIADVAVVTAVNVAATAQEPEARAMSHSHVGAVRESEMMLAWALGQASADRRAYINRFVAGPAAPRRW